MVDILSSSPIESFLHLGPAQAQHRHTLTERNNNMPLDLKAYFLNPSPPTFEVFHLKDTRHLDTKGSMSPNDSDDCNDLDILVTNNDVNDIFSMDYCHDNNVRDMCVTQIGKSCLKNPQKLTALERSLENLEIATSENALKKKVTFADEEGLTLASVKLITERSDDPPFIRSEIICALTNTTCPTVVQQPPLVLRFKQPASDYLAFRERLDKQLVCLENVILKEYDIVGTIKVKNVCYEKHVSVRVTFDGWKSHRDVACEYVTPSTNQNHAHLDAFSFVISVPPSVSKQRKIEFCICYQVAHGQQYWDNNNGENYEVVTSDIEDKDTQIPGDVTIFHKSLYRLGQPDWTTFGSWVGKLDDVPYW